MPDTRTESSAVVDNQVTSGSAELETDARRQAGFRLWTQVLFGERTKEKPGSGGAKSSQDR